MCLLGHDVKYISCCGLEVKKFESACFSSTYTKAEMTLRRLAWLLCKDAMQLHETFHILFMLYDFYHIFKKKV